MVIEDASVGIKVAKNGGMRAIGIHSSKDKELKKYSDLVIESLQEINRIMEFLQGG